MAIYLAQVYFANDSLPEKLQRCVQVSRDVERRRKVVERTQRQDGERRFRIGKFGYGPSDSAVTPSDGDTGGTRAYQAVKVCFHLCFAARDDDVGLMPHQTNEMVKLFDAGTRL